MIEVSQLTKRYGEQRAIDELSFSVGDGEILGFLGPNGAGKSTTMKILTGFLLPTSGEACLAGFSVATDVLEVRRRVGYLPEHNPLYLDMYVHEFLEFSARIYRMDRKCRKQRIREVIELTGLGREQHKQIGMLSKGYRQRVGLSQALLHDPEVLILDEPTTGLDPNQIVDIRALIREVGRDKTVIFSSHILSEVEAVSDRVVILNRGKMVADATPEEVRSAFRDSVMITLEVERPANLDLQPLQDMEGVEQVSREGDLIHLQAQRDLDPRPAIFDLCVAQNNRILGLSQEALTLEDAFRKLTQ